MYTGADTCCQQPYALAVTCDHPQHPPVIYNSAGINMEGEQAGSPAGAQQQLRTSKPHFGTVCTEAIRRLSHVFWWFGGKRDKSLACIQVLSSTFCMLAQNPHISSKASDRLKRTTESVKGQVTPDSIYQGPISERNKMTAETFWLVWLYIM